jgi:hypothetical protein
MTRQTITVDIAPGKDPVKRLSLTQGDIGRQLGVYIKQNDAVLDCSGYTAELYVLKPDGNYFSSILTVDETETNLITWETARQETPLAGECAAQIRIRQGTTNIGTAEFVEYIEESPNQIGIDSETEIHTIEQYVAQAAEYARQAEESAQKFDIESAVGDVNIGTVNASSSTNRTSAINKSGYYPLGIVGSYITAAGQTYTPFLLLKDAYIFERLSGRARIKFTLVNDDSISYSNVVVHFDILWVKE